MYKTLRQPEVLRLDHSLLLSQIQMDSSRKIIKMNAPRVNGIEIDAVEPLEHNYTPEEAIAARGLLHLNPSNLPELLLVQCNLAFLSADKSSETGFFKYCSAADVDDRQQRFLIPAAHARDHILRHFPDQDPREGFPIRVYLISDGTYPLLFKQRRCDNKYVITHRGRPQIRKWSHVCQAIGLNPGDGVKMWGLCHLRSRELCIFIAKQVREG